MQEEKKENFKKTKIFSPWGLPNPGFEPNIPSIADIFFSVWASREVQEKK